MALVLGEHKVVQILPRPEADTECTVASQVVAGAAAEVETSPVAHAAAAAAAVVVADAAVLAAAAIENSASLHSHSSHTRPTVQAEDVAAGAPGLAVVQTATVDYMLVGLEVGQPQRRWQPPNMLNNRAGSPEAVGGQGAKEAEEGYTGAVAAQKDFYAS